MTQIDLFPELTPETQSYHLAIRASLSQLPESKEAQRMTATSGRSLAKLLHTKDPLGAFSKMFMVTLPWASTRCLLTWKPKITPRGRLLCQLAVSMPRTDATGSGLLHTPTATANQMAPSMRSRDAGSWWATPNTMDHLPQRSAESTEKMMQGARKGRSRPSNLREQVNPDTMQMWATPRTTDGTAGPRKLNEKGRRISQANPNLDYGANLSDQVKMWPTPTTRDHKGGYQGGRIRNGKVSMDTLDLAVQHTDNQQKTGGQLNPQWVEWLMGYPEGWTDLKG